MAGYAEYSPDGNAVHHGDRCRENHERPLMEGIAGTAVFLASGMAGKITGVTIDVTCGTISALNYKVTEIPFLEEDS